MKKGKRYKAKKIYRTSNRFKSYSDDYCDLNKINYMRKQLGMEQLIIITRKCLKCDSVFSGIKGIEFCCEKCRKISTSEYE